MNKPLKKIVAIGGGELRNSETLKIDQEIVNLAQKKSPKLLFIPTASSDNMDYYKFIQNYFGNLGCITDVLYLLDKQLKISDIENKILNSDIIYVGGGNTLQMMRVWRRLGVDKLLKAAWEKGIVLCGMSAGSICWFESGHSDSRSFYKPEDWQYINVRGLGLIKGIHCPHYNSTTLDIPRKSHFTNMIQKIGGMGIAIDDGCAIKFIDDKFQVLQSLKSANAFQFYKQNGQVVSKQLKVAEGLLPIEELYTRK